jgi:hypothetical protein
LFSLSSANDPFLKNHFFGCHHEEKVQGNGIALQAVAGTDAVTPGWDITRGMQAEATVSVF